MSADVYYGIGSTHQVCQDFAIADGIYTIVSDGCSSAKDTDWGSRLLTKACYNLIKKKEQPLSFDAKLLDEAINLAGTYVAELGLDSECLAATLMCVYKGENVINVLMSGDGFIIARNKVTNRLTVISHLFESGAPYYLYYNLNDALHNGYKTYYGNGKLQVEKTLYDGEKVISNNEQSSPLAAYCKPIAYSFPLAEYDAVAVVTDGLKSFVQQVKGTTSITNKSVDVGKIVRDLFDFKTTSGQFVHRRCQKVMREYAAQNIKHTDDFAIGVVHV